MTYKLKALLLAIVSIIFMTGGIASTETIDIVLDTAYAPFEFKDSDQVYKGIDVDIINEVAKRQAWNYNMTFPGFDAAVNAIQSGQADALMAGTTITEARKKVFHFSDPYYDTKIVIATRKANPVKKYSDLKGKTVGVKNGTAAQSFLDKHKKSMAILLKHLTRATSCTTVYLPDRLQLSWMMSQLSNMRLAKTKTLPST